MVPEMRGTYLLDNLAVIDELGPGVGNAIRKRLPPGVLAAMGAVDRAAWVPVSFDVALTEAIYAELGESGLRRANRRVFLRELEGPVLAPLMAGVRRLLGLTPAAFIRFAPNLWSSVYRNCGAARLENIAAPRAVLVVEELPDVLLASPPYFVGVSGVADACLELSKKSGTVEVSLDVAARTATWRIDWS